MQSILFFISVEDSVRATIFSTANHTLSTELWDLSTVFTSILRKVCPNRNKLMQIIIGVFLGVLVSAIAWRMGSLSNSGAIGAAVTGGLIFSLGGLPWAVLLLTFFISSNVLSKTFHKQKSSISEKFAKGSERDFGQVFANGGLGTVLVVALVLFPGQSWVWYAYAGAIATVNADTWATELGVLNPHPPRLITNGKMVEPGTSGAISVYGTLATLCGAALIGLLGAVFSTTGWDGRLLLAATLGGACGSLFDSLLGATVQAIYHCPLCDVQTERHPMHPCSTATTHLRGWKWLSNDWVNFLASVVGALITVGLWGLLS